MLSLLLQAGWKWVIFLYGVMVVFVCLLHTTDSLPLPFDFTPQCPNFKVTVPYAPWTLLLTFFSSIIAMLSAPYLPEGYGAPLVWDAVCFLDAVSIHQTDSALMERGIYGLGGFLKVSKELRVLWSRPYLSRLPLGSSLRNLCCFHPCDVEESRSRKAVLCSSIHHEGGDHPSSVVLSSCTSSSTSHGNAIHVSGRII